MLDEYAVVLDEFASRLRAQGVIGSTRLIKGLYQVVRTQDDELLDVVRNMFVNEVTVEYSRQSFKEIPKEIALDLASRLELDRPSGAEDRAPGHNRHRTAEGQVGCQPEPPAPAVPGRP